MVAPPTTYRPTAFLVGSSRPYEPLPVPMSSARWREIEPRLVDLTQLIWAQEIISVMGILDAASGAPSFTGDPFPHVILHNGVGYLEDGHHRCTLALIGGRREVMARVLEV